MESYYSNQAALPHFSGHYRQRGSGFGALAAGIARFAIPIAQKFLFPAAKKIGRELLVQSAPEIVDVVAKRKSPRQAAKEVVRKTVRKQLGAGKRQSKRLRTKKSKRTITRRRKKPRRSRSSFFSKVRE